MSTIWANLVDRLTDDAAGLDPWDIEITTSTGETVALPPILARKRRSILDNRETARIVFCATNNLDPATFRGCHGCGGTGWAWVNNLPCWCEQGKSALRTLRLREEAETARLSELVMNERRVKA
jgi:hypothetical protein